MYGKCGDVAQSSKSSTLTKQIIHRTHWAGLLSPQPQYTRKKYFGALMCCIRLGVLNKRSCHNIWESASSEVPTDRAVRIRPAALKVNRPLKYIRPRPGSEPEASQNPRCPKGNGRPPPQDRPGEGGRARQTFKDVLQCNWEEAEAPIRPIGTPHVWKPHLSTYIRKLKSKFVFWWVLGRFPAKVGPGTLTSGPRF